MPLRTFHVSNPTGRDSCAREVGSSANASTGLGLALWVELDEKLNAHTTWQPLEIFETAPRCRQAQAAESLEWRLLYSRQEKYWTSSPGDCWDYAGARPVGIPITKHEMIGPGVWVTGATMLPGRRLLRKPTPVAMSTVITKEVYRFLRVKAGRHESGWDTPLTGYGSALALSAGKITSEAYRFRDECNRKVSRALGDMQGDWPSAPSACRNIFDCRKGRLSEVPRITIAPCAWQRSLGYDDSPGINFDR